ncbi:MAG: ATP-dependent Clp protease proteolytic subunit [Bacilli bacterium]|nr:ATP-dependent Clp protease proteolytic subunit [Bacilli bacterium]
MLIPTVVEKTNNREIAYDLYSRLLNDNIILIEGEITDTSSNIIVSELLYLNSKNNDEISIFINSPGGSVTAGFAIYDTMNYVKNDIRTIGIGMCASMGAFLLSSGTKGKRNILPNTEVMIHQPLGGVQGQATDIEIVSNHILKTKEKLNKILSYNTGQKLNKIKKDTERDYYLNAKEALEYGIVDEIITPN